MSNSSVLLVGLLVLGVGAYVLSEQKQETTPKPPIRPEPRPYPANTNPPMTGIVQGPYHPQTQEKEPIIGNAMQVKDHV